MASEAAAAPASQQRNEIFVTNLAFSTRELTLARHIEQVAPVLDVHILMTYNNRSKGSAFVRLNDPSQIDEVCAKLNGKPLDGRYLEIARAKPFSELPGRQHRAGGERRGRRFSPVGRRPSSFVGRRKREPNPDRQLSEFTVAVLNLPFVAKEEDMNDLFDEFDIVSSKISRTASGMSRGVAFVTFKTHEDQQRAIATANNNIVESRKIRVVEAFLLQEELDDEAKSNEAAKKKESD